jgi:hypothetical protein
MASVRRSRITVWVFGSVAPISNTIAGDPSWRDLGRKLRKDPLAFNSKPISIIGRVIGGEYRATIFPC